MKISKIISKKIISVAIIVFVLCTALAAGIMMPMSKVAAEDKYPIMGPSNVSIGQLMNYYNNNARYPSFYRDAGSDAPTLDDFCRIYIEECAAENVRVEVAFCQAMNETGFLRFGGAVDIAAYNFAVIGAVDSNPGEFNWFPDVRTGVRAQVQHLKAYASHDSLNNWCVDPRFNYVTRGCAPYVEDLGGRWASGADYGYKIRHQYMDKLGTFNGFTTMYNGVEYNMVYDPNYYLENQADMRNAFANDGYALIAHYVNYGIDEGRQAKEYFNPYVYKNNYVDLRNVYGYTIGNYTRHFVFYGCKEDNRQGWVPNGSTDKVTAQYGIDFANVYDYNYYTQHYPDVKAAYGDDDIGMLYHFVNYGMYEGRQGKGEFSLEGYKNRYLDLRRAFGHDLRNYYFHYQFSGKSEGRDASYIDHYVEPEHSFMGTDFSPVYDYYYYIEHNPDVVAALGNDDMAVFGHFLSDGMNEGRRASANFDLWTYASNYEDLRNAFGWNLRDYYIHYITSGMSEGRIAV